MTDADPHDQRIREEFMVTYGRVVTESRNREQRWIADLRRFGVRGAHPDDGWVNRKDNEVYPTYPQFWQAKAGDLVALGTPERFRLVKLIGYREGILTYWKFVQVTP